MPELSQGILIAVEGIDGSGKSTVAKHLAAYLREQNFKVELTKEPGGTQLGVQLRQMLQHQPVPICNKAEYLLFAADRAQHMYELEPLLEAKKIIISDRMGDSSIAYQGYGRGLDIDMISSINEWALNKHLPDLTIFIRIDITTARARMLERGQKPTTFEEEKNEFMERAAKGFEKIMQAKDQDSVIIIDGAQSEQVIAQQTIQQVSEWLKKKIH